MNDTTDDPDHLINLSQALSIMGDMPISTAYDDPELMELRINLTAPGRRTHTIRFIKQKVLALRAKRIKASEANAAKVRAEVEARVERRRVRQREEKRAKVRLKAEPAPVTKPRKVKLKPRAKLAGAEA